MRDYTKYLIPFILLLFHLDVAAQKLKTVEGSYTYHAPDNVTLEQAKRTALERAQIEALANTFGTNITQHNSTHVSNRNGKSDVNFLSISSSDVKGEWIETIGDPVYNISYEQQMLVVTCNVRGKAREIVSAGVDLKVKVLRNGTDDRFESTEFRSGDDMYLSFQSPIDGFLAVYLLDEDGNAFCLLPYRKQSDGIYKVKAGTRYVFFSETMAPTSEKFIVDEYNLTCEKAQETNQIYILFSSDKFVKALDEDNGEDIPRELSSELFQKWYSKQKTINSNIVLINKLLTIKN